MEPCLICEAVKTQNRAALKFYIKKKKSAGFRGPHTDTWTGRLEMPFISPFIKHIRMGQSNWCGFDTWCFIQVGCLTFRQVDDCHSSSSSHIKLAPPLEVRGTPWLACHSLPSPIPQDLNTSPPPTVSLLPEISTITNMPQNRQPSRSNYIKPATIEMCHRGHGTG